MPSYRTSSILTALACGTLALMLAVFPSLVVWLFLLENAPMGSVLALRASVLFLGLGTIAWFGRDEPDSALRRAVAIGFVVVWAGLALTGLYEFVRGAVGPGIWVAIVAEIALVAIVFPHARGNGRA